MKNSYLKEIIGHMLNYPIYFEASLNQSDSMPRNTYKYNNDNRSRVSSVSSRIETKVPLIFC